MKKPFLILLLLFLLFPIQTARTAQAEGAQPAERMKIYGATFPSTFALYVLDPDLLAGWNGVLRDYEKKYIPEKYQNLPVLGGWYGMGMIPDREVLVRAHFDKALLLTGQNGQHDEALPTLRQLGFDIVTFPNMTMKDNMEMFRGMGRAFAVPERGEELAAYGENSLARVLEALGDLPRDQRKRVYMAQGIDGLNTVCDGSSRTEALEAAGGVNVHQCPDAMKESVGIKLSFEQILRYDPDVVLINHPTFMENYKNDSRWQSLRAAREGHVYNVPYEPFSWLDRPASFMRMIGVQWLAQKLHPDRFPFDLEKETDRFLRLFFRLDLSPQTIAGIVNP